MLASNHNPGPFGTLLNKARLLVTGAFCVACAELFAHHGSGAEMGGGTVIGLAAAAGFATVQALVHAWHTLHLLGHSQEDHDETLAHEADDDRMFNEHLAAAVGTTIGDILKAAPEGTFAPLDQDAVDKLIAIADAAFKEVSHNALMPPELADDQLPMLVERAAEGHFEEWGDAGMWKAILLLMVERAKDVTLLPATLDAAAQVCRKHFIRRFFNTIKTDLEQKGAAFASIHLRMMGELLILSRGNFAEHKITQDLLNALSKNLSGLSNRIENAVSDAVRAQLRPVLAWLRRIDFDQMVFYIWSTNEKATALLAGQAIIADGVQKLVGALPRSPLLDSGLMPTDHGKIPAGGTITLQIDRAQPLRTIRPGVEIVFGSVRLEDGSEAFGEGVRLQATLVNRARRDLLVTNVELVVEEFTEDAADLPDYPRMQQPLHFEVPSSSVEEVVQLTDADGIGSSRPLDVPNWYLSADGPGAHHSLKLSVQAKTSGMWRVRLRATYQSSSDQGPSASCLSDAVRILKK